jgi:SAM-dependent methyltransferase
MPRPPLSERVRATLRLRARDAAERLRGGRDPLVPPRHVELAGRADFAEGGEALARACVELAGLAPDWKVVELGCGHGRTARALTGVLRPPGEYAGLDADREAIGWCRRAYGRRDGFRFLVEADPRLPFADGAFDLALLTLVDALPEEAERRLAESRRVARRACVATAFVLDDDARAAIAEGRAGLPFADAGEPVALLDEAAPQEAVAYGEAWLRERLDVRAVRPGRWRGGDAETFEDVVCA